jgi:hypothetical protein
MSPTPLLDHGLCRKPGYLPGMRDTCCRWLEEVVKQAPVAVLDRLHVLLDHPVGPTLHEATLGPVLKYVDWRPEECATVMPWLDLLAHEAYTLLEDCGQPELAKKAELSIHGLRQLGVLRHIASLPPVEVSDFDMHGFNKVVHFRSCLLQQSRGPCTVDLCLPANKLECHPSLEALNAYAVSFWSGLLLGTNIPSTCAQGVPDGVRARATGALIWTCMGLCYQDQSTQEAMDVQSLLLTQEQHGDRSRAAMSFMADAAEASLACIEDRLKNEG